MKQAFCLFIAVVFLFGAADANGMSWYPVAIMVNQLEYSISALVSF